MRDLVVMGRSTDFRFGGNPIGDRSVYIPRSYFGFHVGPGHRTKVRAGAAVAGEGLDLVLHAPDSLRRNHPALAELSEEDLAPLVEKVVEVEHVDGDLVLRNLSAPGRQVYHGTLGTTGRAAGRIGGRRLAPGASVKIGPGDFVGFLTLAGKLHLYLVVHDATADAEKPGTATENATIGVAAVAAAHAAGNDATMIVERAPDGVAILLPPDRKKRG